LAAETRAAPILSQVESALDQDLRNYFQRRITDALSKGSFGVVLDDQAPSPVPALITDFFGPSITGFVAASQEMAKHLVQCQTGINPEGLLVVASCKMGSKNALAVLKLEKEAGVELTPTQIGGLTTFNMEHLQNLMLTARTRVYKIALFATDGTPPTIFGTVADKQQGPIPSTEVAGFFLKDFLGCKLLEAPEVSTKRFFLASQEYINTAVSDPEKKARYEIALLSYMGNVSQTINAVTFAAEHLETPDRQPFLTSIGQQGLIAREFPKDISLVRTQITKIQVSFRSGIMLLAPPDALNSRVDFEQQDSGSTKVSFEDTLTGMRGK
jgi:hypothetical protein